MPATTDTTERGLERLICTALTGHPCDPPVANSVEIQQPAYGGVGWICGNPRDYNRDYCLDLAQLSAFLSITQPEMVATLDLLNDSPTHRGFLARLESEITKHGTIAVLRNGIDHEAHHVDLFYGTPSRGNRRAEELHEKNVFSITRQLQYSNTDLHNALDMGLFVNGLPVFTFELKNNLTRQTVHDAVQQYRCDRDQKEKLFNFGRCVAHFAVDEQEVRFCTHLRGKASWFLPFNRGWNDGAGNPPNPDGLKTDYLWREVLTRESLTNILENYAQVVTTKDDRTGKKKKRQIWPRYHQLDVVRRLLSDAEEKGTGQRYLIQHSAGSGKSNSISWLAHQLIGLVKNGKPIFDSIIVVTDRRILDQQIKETIKQFAQVSATVGHADRSGDLRKFLETGKKIIISTVQKFPFILSKIGNEQRGRRFAIIIDEAHSSQGGKTSTAVAQALGEAGEEAEHETFEDQINRLMESRKLLPNASYFAFTATPKNKTLELFGAPDSQPDGTVKHHPFHSYTMKQAIQEGFILDVLRHYTPVNSYYRLVKTVESDPEFDTRRAKKKLRRYVEGHDYAIRLKAEIMVDHFHEQVLAPRKIVGQARAMVVTSSIERAIQYFHAIREYLTERKSPHRAIVAFSGKHDYRDGNVTESSLNDFSSNQIADKIREDPYRFLICADKFQTGYDEPLLHTIYVDKPLSGIKAVQTLSRLNRAHPMKHDVFVLDFMNDVNTIQSAFADYYQTTILSQETDPNILHDLKAELDGYQVYGTEQLNDFVERFLSDEPREQLDPLLDVCVAVYLKLDEDGQVEFKGKAKAFLRTYAFLASVLPYAKAEWEKLSILLQLLTPKLPSPKDEDLSKGILETIDMDSYRVEKQAVRAIQLSDTDAEIDPLSAEGAGPRPEPEPDRLSNIIRQFNDRFGNVNWADTDRVQQLITKEIPATVEKDEAYRNARQNSDEQNIRIEFDRALERVVTGRLQDDAQLYRQFYDNQDFQRWMRNAIYTIIRERSFPLNPHTP